MTKKHCSSITPTSNPNRFLLLDSMRGELSILTIDRNGVGRITDPVVEDHRGSEPTTASCGVGQVQGGLSGAAVGGCLSGGLFNESGLAQTKEYLSSTEREALLAQALEKNRAHLITTLKDVVSGLIDNGAFDTAKRTIDQYAKKIAETK